MTEKSSIDNLQAVIDSKDYEVIADLCDEIKADYGPFVVQLSYDDNPENPCNEDGWQTYSFSTQHDNYKHPEEMGLGSLDEDGRPTVESKELQQKLDNGLAFILSYYEHGHCIWSLQDAGPRCHWDGTRIAGILSWEADEGDIGAESYEDRKKDAEQFLERFTLWCNGEVYGYEFTNGEDGCWGYYGNDLAYMFEQIQMIAGDRPVEFIGDAAYLAKYHWKQ